MRDNLLEELTKMTTKAIDQVDIVNQRLIRLIIIISIVSGLTIIGTICACCGFYFLSDYQYPEVSQTTTQDNGITTQEINQKITQEIMQKGGEK